MTATMLFKMRWIPSSFQVCTGYKIMHMQSSCHIVLSYAHKNIFRHSASVAFSTAVSSFCAKAASLKLWGYKLWGYKCHSTYRYKTCRSEKVSCTRPNIKLIIPRCKVKPNAVNCLNLADLAGSFHFPSVLQTTQ